MATYPSTIKQSVASTFGPLDDIKVDRASNGTPRIRAIFTRQPRVGNIVHEGVTAAQKATLDAFYTTNRLIAFSFVWAGDGVTYSCYFSGPIEARPLPGNYWHLSMHCVEA